MKKLIYIFILLNASLLQAQNLVVNESFENYTSCPNNQGQLNQATPWVSAHGTCDLYNACNAGNYGVPNNISGNQTARTGNGYAGFFATQGYFEVREYLHSQLSTPLVAGNTYCVTFYVVLADEVDSWGEQIYDVAVNDIGMYIGTSSIAPAPSNFNYIPVTPQIINDASAQILDDRNNWMEISGAYTAVGGEQYITIGSFSSQATQDTTWLDTWNSNNWAYYLIDDVSIVDCSTNNNLLATINGIDSICEGETATFSLSISGGTSPYSYSWDNGLPVDTFQSVTPNVTTTYQTTITDSIGQTITESFTVYVTPLPVANAGNDVQICNDSAVVLMATGSGSYLWNTGATTSSISVMPSTTTTYFVEVSNLGCTDSDSVMVSVINCSVPPLSASINGIDSICEGETASFSLSISGGTPPYTYSWDNNLPVDTFQSVTPSLTTIFEVIVSDSTGQSVTQQFTVYVTPLPNANAGNDIQLCEDSETTLTATGGGTYLWNTGDTSSSIYVKPNITTIYSVTVSFLGCINNDDVTVNIISCTETESSMLIPNIFTPNNDHQNDLFKVISESIVEFKCEIFNRWGNLIYTLNSINEVWDGRTNSGNICPEGVYFYVINAKGYDNVIYKENGTIQLLR
ncbi:MAG: gliding motility-associated C-terminal domain-containing protein [Flavobacteriales bacterium]